MPKRTSSPTSSLPADPPSNLIRVRLWADASHVEQLADTVTQMLETSGYRVLERSNYPCRPPKQLEARVYLTIARVASSA